MLLPAAAIAIGVTGRDLFGLSTDVVVCLLAVVGVALIGGLGPTLLAAVLGGLALNFFLTPPLYTLTIADRANVITLVLMLVVAVMVAMVVDRAARRATQAARAHTEASLLASFARTVLTDPDPLPRLLDKIRESFALTSVALLERHDGRWQLAASTGPDPCTSPDQADADITVTDDVRLALRGRAVTAADQLTLEAAAGDPELMLSPTDSAELLATVEESTDRLRALVDNLLDSSRLATGAITPALYPVGYDEVVLRALSGSTAASVFRSTSTNRCRTCSRSRAARTGRRQRRRQRAAPRRRVTGRGPRQRAR